MKLVHAADLHVDSPMLGLSRYEGAPVERLRGATRRAFEGLVELCLRERARFLVLAGDVFDDDWRDMNTGLWFLKALGRLREVGTDVVLVRGNHDFQLTAALAWPPYLHELSREGESLRFEREGVVFHGASFPSRHVRESLLPRYCHALQGLCNVGVLHTNATASREHGDYAPCTVEDLLDKGYDYFALGHVHRRAVLHRAPWVVYPGNLQGRQFREDGAKGCMLVEIDEARVSSARFVDTSVVRWFDRRITLGTDDDLDALLARTRAELRAAADGAEGRLAAVRLTIDGPCAAHAAVVDRASWIVDQIRADATDLDDAVFLGEVRLETTPAATIEALRAAQGLVAELLREIERLRADEVDLAAHASALAPIANKAGDVVDVSDPAFVARVLDAAEALLAQRLTEGEG